MSSPRAPWLAAAALTVVQGAALALGVLVVGGSATAALVVVCLGGLSLPAAWLLTGAEASASQADVALRAAISLLSLTAVVVLLEAAVVVGLGRPATGGERTVLGWSAGAMAVAAVAWRPARRRLADRINRLLYGEAEDPSDALRTWGARLSRSVPMDELLLQLTESLSKAFRLSRSEVWTGSDGRYDRVAAVPDRGLGELKLNEREESVTAAAGVVGRGWLQVWIPSLLDEMDDSEVRIAPVAHAGELLGLLVVARSQSLGAFAASDEQALAELARQVGLALHNVQLDSALQASLDEVRRQAGELQASRARIVAAGDEQRRKIERDLHDGAQQHLVALNVKVGLARQVLAEDPEAAAELLTQLSSDVKDTLQELRNLAHGIYPPLLRDAGITSALQAAAARNALPTSVDAGEVGRFPAEVEAAVYFCCLEAFQNAGKYAGAGATIGARVWCDDGLLRFEVVDDGVGFELDATKGAGFVNMNDRLGAMGGSVRVESAPGKGTIVRGAVPAGEPC